ncbi:MAG: putative helicase [Planctomycetaceae bacterium]|jgi:predicted helicase
MACGTGKTFTSLKIAEELAGKGKRVLFLVPSLSLLSQTLTEWTQQSRTPLHSFAVCSDAEVGKKRKADDDIVQTFIHELRYPATTDTLRLAEEMSKRHDAAHMSVVFSTYHSIEVIHKAQHNHGFADFDLIICDEAHRTTGATFDSETESAFVRVHDAKFIRASKRLYMTATPRIYADIAKATAIRDNVAICSMDDEEIYGKQLHVITFSEAVELGLLSDYKVIVLTIDEDHVSERLQDLLKDDNNQLKVDDAARIIGCWKALSKQGLTSELDEDTAPMQKAVAFCQVIEPSTGKKTHKVSSKQISEMFQDIVEAYQEGAGDDAIPLRCEAAHVDGSMNATTKEEKLTWLKEESSPDTCRILSNVRCLSEGVDVPALDAVLFLSPRSSQVEVVQSVGRVMRKSPGKKLGYVILPVVIPHGMAPHEALSDNKVYKVVWEVLQALRSHDDRFDAFVNKLDLIEKAPDRMEVIAITDTLSPKAKGTDRKDAGKGEFDLGSNESASKEVQRNLQFDVGELERALYARLVKKCGNRYYWEEWASDIAKIAQTHIGRIATILKNPSNEKEISAFAIFADELRDDLNDSITDEEVVEMLAQHLITKPVFDALFADYSFARHNPVSQGMQNLLDLLDEHRLDKEAETLEQFYASVRRRADGIDNAEGKQKIVVELYDKFFRNAFPRMTERLGIVYTPVEVVDFIIHSVNDILQEEFGQTLGSKGVHILDPFVGTGTFITRLMQSGLITPEQLPHKYKHEIHCNEIVLLAYYIAAINIEAVYHGIVGGKYEPFDGICLTDTFQMYESDDQFEQFFPDNSKRRKRQKKLDIRVIVGNPPYSVGQGSENDANENVGYDVLDQAIRESYVRHSTATLSRNLYDSYVRAIRWGTDRIGESGVLAYVSNASFVAKNSMDGLRKSLVDDFDSIYCFNLRGDQRTSGEQSKKEAGKIFDSGSRTPVAITIFVKHKARRTSCALHYFDIGDYKSREEKLQIIQQRGSIRDIDWVRIEPNAEGDWIHQRNPAVQEFAPIGEKKGAGKIPPIFTLYSLGVATNRDAWACNFSRTKLAENMNAMIAFYNEQLAEYISEVDSAMSGQTPKVGQFINNDPKRISWTDRIKKDLAKLKRHSFIPESIVSVTYRPFCRQYLYFNRSFNERVYKMPSIFPNPDSSNRIISVVGPGARQDFSALIVDQLADLHLAPDGAQCFPLYIFDESDIQTGDLPGLEGDTEQDFNRREAISDKVVNQLRARYSETKIAKEDVFYFVYGILHSPEYKSGFSADLKKELPRIPGMKKFEDFQAFSQAGRDLTHWHLDYESVDCHPVMLDFTGGPQKLSACKDEHFYVRKMKFPKVKDAHTGKSVNDRTTVIYNEYITIRDIPLEAYDYVVNGKSAIEWVMERQAVTTEKKSGIVNDANLWATETMHSAAYPLELLMRIITVSLETMKIVNSLPKLDID